jgi:hypothetical protein
MVLGAVAMLAACSGGGLPAGDSADLGVSTAMDLSAAATDLSAAALDLSPARDLARAHDLSAGVDLSMPLDLSPPPDLWRPGPDLSIVTQPPCTPAGGSMHAQYVWNDALLPMQRSDYAIDLNGDGRVDDQLGNICGAIAGQNLPLQAQATQSVTSGQSLALFDEHADDLTNDDCAASDVVPATPTASPDFSGSGQFNVDATATVGHFAGPIVAGQFSSLPPPAVAAAPVTVTVKLPLLGANTPLEVVGARVQYTRGADGRITGGQLNGAIRNSDVQGKLIPGLAASLTAQVQTIPLSETAMQILSIFDNGGKFDPSCAAGTCKNPDGSCAVKGDRVISVCEVATAGLIQNVLAPDVQMFDAAGNYHPSPANDHKDSLSIGLGFTAVPATF